MAKNPISQDEIKDIKEYKEYLDDTIAKYKSLQEELKKYNKYVATGAREAIKAQLRDITEQLGTYKEITSELKKYDNLIKKIEKQELDIKNQTKERAEDTKTIVDNLKEQNKELSEQEKRIKTLGEDWNDIDDLQTSISSEYGKQYGEIGAIQKKIDGTRAIVSSISEVLKNDSKSYEDQLDKILQISERYKEFPSDFARMNKERKRGTLTEKGMISQLEDNLDEFDEMISKIRITNDETEQLVELFKKLRDEQAAFNNAQKVKYDTKEAAGELGSRFFGGAPYVGEALSSAGSTAGKIFSGETLAAASLVGVGYITAKGAAYEAAINDVNSGMVRAMSTFIGKSRIFDATIAQIEKDMDSRTKEIEFEKGFTKAFALFDFETEMGQLEMQFDKVSKTAFFGSGLGSVKYAKDQLELAGISADVIVSTMSEMSMGANNSIQDLSEDIAVFSKKTGIASSQVAGITGLFRMLDKSKGVDAFKELTEYLTAADADKFNIADIANELENSYQGALLANIKNSKELEKQLLSVRQMGSSMPKVLDAGKNMVLNFKDSISKQMELSTMIGESVDFSTAMSYFQQARYDEGLQSLRDSGILQKAQAYGPQAVATLDSIFSVEELAKQPMEKGQSAGIKSNKEFLSAYEEAARQQKILSAEFDIDRAIIRMRAENLERGLIYAIGTDEELATLEVSKMNLEIRKFFDVELESLKEGVNAALNPFYKINRYSGMSSSGTPIIKPEKKGFQPGDIYDFNQSPISKTKQPSKTTTKIELVDSSVVVKPLEVSNQSLKKIDVSSNAQTALLQNIQTLTATMSNLPLGFEGMKLFIDGKDVKSRIETIKTQEKGKIRS